LIPIRNASIKHATYDPRLYFPIFTAVNFVLSYSNFGIRAGILIGFFGLMVPLALAISASRPISPAENFFSSKDFLDRPPLWLWIALLGLAVFWRFYKLVSLPVWPMWDDAASSFFCVKQFEHWSWAFWYSSEKAGPLYPWIRALFYHIFPPSLFSLWLLQALLSTVTLFAGYWACRKNFSPAFGCVYILILAFSFWPLYLGQFCIPASLIVPWQFLVLGLLGLYLKNLQKNSRGIYALILGLGLGVGFYIWIPTLTFIVLVTAIVLWTGFQGGAGTMKNLIFFSAAFILLSAPMLAGTLFNIFNGHAYTQLILFNRNNSLIRQGICSLSYLTVFLWGPLDKSFCFGPFFGGFLNPFLGSAFLLGLIELFRFRKKNIFYWVAFSGVLLLAPGVLSTSIEMMRVLPMLPLVLFLVVLGLKNWLLSFSKPSRSYLLLGLLAFSFGLDSYHLWGPYHQWAVPGPQSGPYKSPERYQAFQILEEESAQKGPGLILTELVPDIFDQSLFTATYSFNAAINPRLDPLKVSWAALLISARYQPYLAEIFPGARFDELGEGLSRPGGPLLLARIPWTAESSPILQRWLRAQKSIEPLFALMPFNTRLSSYGPVIAAVENQKAFFQGDPFLESCFWERLSSLNESDNGLMDQARQAALQGVAACSTDPLLDLQCGHFWQKLANYDEYYYQDDIRAIDALHHVIQKKYHQAQAYRQLAGLLARMGKKAEAESAAKVAAYYESRPALPQP
jgi:hypothetical protein